MRESSLAAGDASGVLQRVRALLDRGPRPGRSKRPSITLTYAQSLDGCISAEVGTATRISNSSSQVLCHHLRAMHDAIMVGVTTVEVDDPQLTVRCVPGDHPRPVVIDSRLRTPPSARLLQRADAVPLIATTGAAPEGRAKALEERGATILRLDEDASGRVDLAQLFTRLQDLGISSVMVEGGGRIITSILRSRLADQLVLAIAPRFLGGVGSVGSLSGIEGDRRPRLERPYYASLDGDLVVHGELDWSA